MAQTIKLRRSASAGATPTTSQLELGEVAINTYDGKMYIKKSVGGTESIVEIGEGSSGIIEEFLYTATSGQTAFSGNDDNSDSLFYVAGAVQVFLNGILLDPETDYTATNGTLVTLVSAAAVNDYLQIFTFKKKIGDSSITINTFTGNNSTTAFTLSLNPGDENNTRVFIDGVYQSKSNYSVSGTTLTFSSAPPSSTNIEVEIGNRAVSLDTLSNLDLPDNVKLRLGSSEDLEIYHDTSDSLINDNGTGSLKLQTGGSTKLEVTSTGVDITGNIGVSGTVDSVDIAARDAVLTSTTTTAGAALPRTGGAMTGAITTNSTFDGRDVATDGTKLDGIETSATADQTQSEINALGITATGLSGTPNIAVGTVSSGNITTTGELRGPASFTIDPAAVGDNTGTVIIKGNLQVDGSQTTINSTTVNIDDLNLTLASGAANGTAANGAGITIDGASATLTYASAGDNWAFNKNLDITGTATMDGLTVNSAGVDQVALFESTDQFADIALKDSGGTSYIRQTNGSLLLQADRGNASTNSIVQISVDNSQVARFSAGGDVSFYEDTGTTAKVFWDASAEKLTVGGSLQFFNNGSNSVVDGGDNLRLRATNNVKIQNFNSTETMAEFVPSGAVTLKHANSPKLATTSTGIDVTGTATMDGLISHTGSNATDIASLSGSAAGRALRIQSYDTSIAGSGFDINASGSAGEITLQTYAKDRLRIDAIGDISFYEDTGTTAKLFWDASAESLGIGTSSPASLVHIQGNTDTADSFLNIEDADTSAGSQRPHIKFVGNGTQIGKIRVLDTTGMQFLTGGSDTIAMTIDRSQNVGIGTSSPANKFVVAEGTNQHGIELAPGTTSYIQAYDRATSDYGDLKIDAQTIAFGTDNGSERMRIEAGGQVVLTASTPSIKMIDSDDNSAQFIQGYGGGLGYYADDNNAISNSFHRFFIDGTEKVRIDSSGKVGINTDSPSRQLEVQSSTGGNAYLSVKRDNATSTELVIGAENGNTAISSEGAIPMAFYTGGTERMRIDSSGRVGIGTSSVRAKLDLVSSTSATPTDFNASSIFIEETGNNKYGGLTFVGGNNNGDTGTVAKLLVQNTNTAGGFEGAMMFSTRNSSNSMQERMRIDSSGNVGIGVTPTAKFHVKASANTYAGGFRLEGVDETTALGIAHVNGDNYFSGNATDDHLVLTGSGNVGIGNSSPSALSWPNGSTGGLFLQAGGLLSAYNAGTVLSQNWYYNGGEKYIANGSASRYSQSGAEHIWSSAGNNTSGAGAGLTWSESMRIDSSGNLLVGTSTSVSASKLTVSGATMILHDSSGSVLRFQKTLGTNTAFIANRSYGFHNGNGLAVATTDSNPIRFATNDTERMRIDSSGNLLVGTTSTSLYNDTSGGGINLFASGGVTFAKQASSASDPVLLLNNTGTDGQIIDLRKDGTTVGSINSYSNYLGIGKNDIALLFVDSFNYIEPFSFTSGTKRDAAIDLGHSGARFKDFYLSGAVNLTNSTTTAFTQVGSNMFQLGTNSADPTVFYTSGAERMRIDSSGNVLINCTSAEAYPGATFSKVTNGTTLCSNTIASGHEFQTFRYYNGQNGAISLSGTSGVTYATTSDYRLKENVVPMTGSIDRVKALKPSRFNFISESDRTVDGFLAHEAQAVVPECVTGTKDAMRDEEYEVTAAVYEDVITPAVEAVDAVVDEDGVVITEAVEAVAETTESVLVTEAVMGTRSVPDMQGIDQAKLVPLLTAALQEAITQIESLTARISALEE